MLFAKYKYLKLNVLKEGNTTNLNISIHIEVELYLHLMATMTQGLPWHA
jgi:hypothetical protein